MLILLKILACNKQILMLALFMLLASSTFKQSLTLILLMILDCNRQILLRKLSNLMFHIVVAIFVIIKLCLHIDWIIYGFFNNINKPSRSQENTIPVIANDTKITEEFSDLDKPEFRESSNCGSNTAFSSKNAKKQKFKQKNKRNFYKSSPISEGVKTVENNAYGTVQFDVSKVEISGSPMPPLVGDEIEEDKMNGLTETTATMGNHSATSSVSDLRTNNSKKQIDIQQRDVNDNIKMPSSLSESKNYANNFDLSIEPFHASIRTGENGKRMLGSITVQESPSSLTPSVVTAATKCITDSFPMERSNNELHNHSGCISIAELKDKGNKNNNIIEIVEKLQTSLHHTSSGIIEKCSNIIDVTHNNSAAIVKQTLKHLLLIGKQEMVHLDYKRQLYSVKGDLDADKRKAEITGYIRLISDIMAMYNTPDTVALPYTSISQIPFSASFIAFGVDFKETRNEPFIAYPIDHKDISRGFIDINALQDHFSRCIPDMPIYTYHEIDITESDLQHFLSNGIHWMKSGLYGMLEIIHDKTIGPIFVSPVSDRKPEKKTKNDIANKLYIRLQARTKCIDNDARYENECYKKFNSDVSKYAYQLDNLKSKIKPSKCFKVLIFSSFNAKWKENEEMTKFINSICNVKWNIVMFTSEVSHDEEDLFSSTLNETARLPVTVIVPDEMEKQQDPLWKNIFEEIGHEQRYLYLPFTGHGCSKEKYYISLLGLMNKIFDQVELPMQLLVFNYIHNPSTTNATTQVTDTIQNAWDSAKVVPESDDEVFLNNRFVFLSHHSSLLSVIEKAYLPQCDERFIPIAAPHQQLSSFFQVFHDRNKYSKQLSLPGAVGKVNIPDEDLKRMNVYFQFYSVSKCTDWWQSLSSAEEKERCREECQKKFLQGYPIEPESLYLQKRGIETIYVKREQMDEACKQVRSVLKNIENIKLKNNIIRLVHEPSAGGTSLARAILWEICDDYPAIILRMGNEINYSDIISWLEYLYILCKKPICILADANIVKMQYTDIRNFSYMISNNRNEVKAAIIYVEQVAYIDREHDILLQNKLTLDETDKLDELMAVASKLLEKTPFKTLSLYTLCQFGRNFQLLEENLKKVSSFGKSCDKYLLLLSAVVHYYSKQPLPFYFVAKIFNKDPEYFFYNLQESLSLLGSSKDFLLVEEYEESADNYHNGIRPVTSFVSEKILSIIFDHPRKYLPAFIEVLLNQIEESKICVQAVTALSSPLFVQRKVLFEGKKEKFSRFVTDLERHIGVNETAIKLEMIADKVGYLTTEYGPHVLAMFARYIANQKNDIEKALTVMKRALIVQKNETFHTTKSNDSLLLTTAGNFLARKLDRMEKESALCDWQSVAKQIFNDATLILHRAQKSELNCYPFSIEARLCYNYMNLYYSKECKKNPSSFSKMLLDEHVPEELKVATETAHKKLSDLEYLLQKHHMEGYVETETEENIVDLRMKLLGLKVDIDRMKTDVFVENCKSDLWLAYGIVDFYFHQIKLRQKREIAEKMKHGLCPSADEQMTPSFEMLAPQALESIIHIFEEHTTYCLSRTNYRNVILAIIYIYKSPPRHCRGNLDMAQRYAELWIKSYSDDHRAQYYIALVNLIRAVGSSTENQQHSSQLKKDFVKKTNDHLTKCKKLLQDKRPLEKLFRHKWHPAELQFVIGKYTTLEALIPKDSRYNFDDVRQEKNLKIFTGKAKSIEQPHRLWCDELKSEVTIPIEFKSIYKKYKKELRQYWFALQVRTSGFHVEHLFPENPAAEFHEDK